MTQGSLMVDKAKRQKKAFITEQDASDLLKRYEITTVMTLLQEVANFPDPKIDWNELVKKTSTGISNPREYQMLWRHLAYRDELNEKLEDGTEPLDDDSDLEYELEAFPANSSEAANEAAVCVKVMIASGLQSESNLPNSAMVEAPLMINVPNNSMEGKNIVIPVSVQKQPLPSLQPTESLDINGTTGGNFASRRKRKPWSMEEDDALIAAVNKCGEGNWASIGKNDFNGERTPSQLSQRWATLRKKNSNLNAATNSCGPRLTEEHMATNHAIYSALGSAGNALNNTIRSNLLQRNTTSGTVEGSYVASSSTGQVQQSQQALLPTKSPPMGSLASSAKYVVGSKKPLPKSNLSSVSAVRATAVAVGAHIASSSDATALIKAAQSKSTVRINAADGFSTVQILKPPIQNPPSMIKLPSISCRQSNGVSSVVIDSCLRPEMKTKEPKIPNPCSVPREKIQEDCASAVQSVPSELIHEDKAVLQNPGTMSTSEVPLAQNKSCTSNIETTKSDCKATNDNVGEQRENANCVKVNIPGGETHPTAHSSCKDQNTDEKPANLPCLAQDGSNKKLDLPVKVEVDRT